MGFWGPGGSTQAGPARPRVQSFLPSLRVDKPSVGYPIDQIQFSRCAKDLWFGGDHSGRSTWVVRIPIFLNNKYGVADCFLLPGHTPMLLGRPVMELPTNKFRFLVVIGAD